MENFLAISPPNNNAIALSSPRQFLQLPSTFPSLSKIISPWHTDAQGKPQNIPSISSSFATPSFKLSKLQTIHTFMDTLSFYKQILNPKQQLQLFHQLLKQESHLLQKDIKNFSMIEILIAISIIVTFSGLTGVVFAKVYEETRVSNALLDLSRIQEALVMYFTRNFRYPLELEELLERGDLNKVPRDPWGLDYIYVPQVDWSRLNRLLMTTGGKNNGSQIQYFIDALKKLKTVLTSSLPESIEPIQLISLSNEQPFAFGMGSKLPLFSSKIDINVSREKVKQVAQLMKVALDRSSAIPELHAQIQEVLNLVKK